MTTSSTVSKHRPCSCGHAFEEHGSAERTDEYGRSVRVPGACLAKVGEHVERDRVQTCRIPAHVHDQRICGKVCLSREHVHDESCFASYENTVPETCKCPSYDPRNAEERGADAYHEGRECVWCAQPESAHSKEEPRFCTRPPGPGYPYGWRDHNCHGYLPRSEFRLDPQAHMRPGGRSPQLAERTARERAKQAEQDARLTEYYSRLTNGD